MNEIEINNIVTKQRSFFRTGVTLPVAYRIEALKKLKTAIEQHEDEIGSCIRQDLGKSSFESYMCETGLVLSEIKYSLQGTTQGRYLTGGVLPVRFSM